MQVYEYEPSGSTPDSEHPAEALDEYVIQGHGFEILGKLYSLIAYKVNDCSTEI